ncbi:MAG: DinB family protein [Ginsengibacter sp.]
MAEQKPEVWQRGPHEGVPDLLQPIAHALLQAREEVEELTNNFPDDLMWKRPAGVASPAFHLQHLTGVLDRLFTYSKEQSLSEIQLHALSIEGDQANTHYTLHELVQLFKKQVDIVVEELKTVDTKTLTHQRTIGRKKIPTTFIGLYIHSAEHTMRHVGQLHVTIKILVGLNTNPSLS